jgi:putative redox protein
MSAAGKIFSEPTVKPGTVVVAETGSGLSQYLLDGRHRLIADEPESKGGNDRGPGPYELILMALGACTAVTLRLYADRKQWPLERVIVRLSHSRDYVQDSAGTDGKPVMLDHIACDLELVGQLDQDQHDRLLIIANNCPVHRSLMSKMDITTRITPPA